MNCRPAGADFHSLHSRNPATIIFASGLVQRHSASDGAGGGLDRFADPLGQITQYAFDANNNLASVTHPDGMVRSYHYENATYKNALTGITGNPNRCTGARCPPV